MPLAPFQRALGACAANLLLPGTGHLWLGRRSKGLVLCGAILALFVLGVAMGARLSFYGGGDDLLALLTSCVQPAVGLPYALARLLGVSAGHIQAPTFDYGNTYTGVAGLLNLLVTLDAWDTALAPGPGEPGEAGGLVS